MKKKLLILKVIDIFLAIWILYAVCNKYWFRTNEDLAYIFGFAKTFGEINLDDNFILRDTYDSVMDGGLKFPETYWAVGIVEETEDAFGGRSIENAETFFHWGGFLGVALIFIDILFLVVNNRFYLIQITLSYFYISAFWICHRYDGMLKISGAAIVIGLVAIADAILRIVQGHIIYKQSLGDTALDIGSSEQAQPERIEYAWIWKAGKWLIDSPLCSGSVLPTMTVLVLYAVEVILFLGNKMSYYSVPWFFRFIEALLIGYAVIYIYCRRAKFVVVLAVCSTAASLIENRNIIGYYGIWHNIGTVYYVLLICVILALETFVISTERNKILYMTLSAVLIRTVISQSFSYGSIYIRWDSANAYLVLGILIPVILYLYKREFFLQISKITDTQISESTASIRLVSSNVNISRYFNVCSKPEKNCRNCGSRIKHPGRFCPFCGTRIEEFEKEI